MITKEQFTEGIINYIDAEVMGKLPASGKWVIGAAVMTMKPQASSVIDSLSRNSLVKAMDVVDAAGNIDADKLISNLAKSADKYGTAEMDIPIVGKLRFNGDDVRTLGRHLGVAV